MMSMLLPVKRKTYQCSFFADTVIAGIIIWIEEDISRFMDIKLLSSKSGYSRWHFQKLFYRVTGLSIAAYIRKRRIEQAAEMLLSTDMAIIDVCESVGYTNRASFFRQFKKHFLVSPITYRKQQSVKNVSP
ncbi:AraC family transcriptional regulator [Klebsiella sp. T2.Ur]|nr:AraC family transcriptional regulator [Klebsiella sp. T2.Ur]